MSPLDALKKANIGDLIVGIDHVGVAARNIDQLGQLWSALTGNDIVGREDVTAAKATASFVRFGNNAAAIELVSPLGENRGLDSFLNKRGETLHHLALRVTNLDEALRKLIDAEVALVDKTPRIGAGGHRVAFLHPKAMGGTLVELIEYHGEE